MREARFWKAGEGSEVLCRLCRFYCRIAPGKRGRCGVRLNRNGVLQTLVYGTSIAEQIDPVEKKPLFHVGPGHRTFSIATVGCNFSCRNCQNYAISQYPQAAGEIIGDKLPPATAVEKALAGDCRSIAYTYTEPTIFFEYAFDTAVLAKEAGLMNLFVSNGYITPEPLAAIVPYLDAANIDLKGFNPVTYRELTGAELNGVLATLRDYKRHDIWLEITTLIIPGINDSDAELQAIAGFIRDELGDETPWHVSAFHPTYRLTATPPTPAETIRRACAIGLAAGLRYVYSGNLPGDDGESTFCPGCGVKVIERHGFRVKSLALRHGCCTACGAAIAGRQLP